MDGRVNQKARTREAILVAATELLREGRSVTVPDAAGRARVSPATAYRYFSSAEDLAEEAALEMVQGVVASDATSEAIEAAGSDVHSRLEALIRSMGWTMITDQMPFRRAAMAGLARWVAQQQDPPDQRTLVRMGRRDKSTRLVLEPIKPLLDEAEYGRLVSALNVGWGTEAMISLTDINRLEPEAALEVMLATCRWILDGAMRDAGLQ